MRSILLFCFLALIGSCTQSSHSELEDNAWYHELRGLSAEQFQEEYQALRNRIRERRTSWSPEGRKKNLVEKARSYLYTTMNDSLFQFWMDTPWDFNGTSQLPGEGSIACGYFVTTTLEHAGFQLDRVRLAQQAASSIINSLCVKDQIRIFSNGKRGKLKEYLKKRPDSIYILGLDSHVGFVQKKDTSVFMIHSSGFKPWKVVRESFDECAAIQYSQFFMIGDLLYSDNSIRKWIRGEKFELIE